MREGHLGLLGLQEWVPLLGDILELGSRPGEETRLWVTVPVARGLSG